MQQGTENPNPYNIVSGKFNLNVQNTQEFLCALGIEIGEFGADGMWGNDTKNAIKKLLGIETIDSLDEVTYNTIKKMWI